MGLAIDVIVKKLDSRNEEDRCNVYFTGLGHAVTFLFACFFPCMLVMSSNTNIYVITKHINDTVFLANF